ncbi:MAG: hypothetical protein EZS28_039288, partial [Streblomastix strix]
MEQERRRLLQEQGFQVLATLGKGAFGHVYQVQKEGLGIIAAKVMNEEEFDIREWRAGFQLTQDADNPFLLKYNSTQMFGIITVILMEFANIGNLDSIIEAKKDIPLPIIRVIMKQI